MNASFAYRFQAIRGRQAGRDYFVALCPLKLIPKLFLYDDPEVPAELRAQRTLNKQRVPEIARYLANNPETYVLSSITASIDGDIAFDPIDESAKDIGVLTVSMAARLLINDGQHRRAAIEEAIELKRELGDETISVVFFVDNGLGRSQQMFADLNRFAVRPSQSLGILYDHRDPHAVIVRTLADEVAPYQGLVDWEKTSLAKRSVKLFTASAMYQGVRSLLGVGKDAPAPSEQEVELAVSFWRAVGENMPDWQHAHGRRVATAELRQEYVHAHGVALTAIGRAGCQLIASSPTGWQEALEGLKDVDWRRGNASWDGTVIVNGRVSKANDAIDWLSRSILAKCEPRLVASKGRKRRPVGGAV